jgi:hypothetical protein
MTSNTAIPGKTLPPSHTPAASPAPTTSSFESRRPSQSPSQPIPTPRKGQGARKQHRNQRRAGTVLVHDDELMEMEAIKNPTGRRGRTSITHLLNYRVPGTTAYDHYTRPYRRTQPPAAGGAYDKQRYVRANYRFVVSPDGHYKTEAADADASIHWDSVLQVVASAMSQAASCPICLVEPVAPRMAKCGHIFCLPCLIRYMNSETDEGKAGPARRWKKCPICEELVYLHEVRPVRFYSGQENPLPQVGDDVVLRLMARNAASTLALPREGGTETLNAGQDIPWHYEANVVDYGRLMKGTSTYMTDQHDDEIGALLKQEREDEMMYGEDAEWTQRAIKAIRAQKEKMETLGRAGAPIPDDEPSGKQKGRDSGPDFFFYCAPPHLYLSPLDIRILKTKYGDFSLFPATLLPKVEHISTGHVVDDALRKRAKYLGHLPRGCLVSFLECDWTDIVPSETLEQFAGEIEKRRKRNRDKAAQEERERLQAERIEAAALRSSVPRRYDAGDDEPAPKVDMADFLPLGSEAATASSPPEPRRGFAQLADLSTSPSASRTTVWGTPAVASSPPAEPVREPVSVDDGWLKDEDLALDDGVAVQLEALGIEEASATPKKGKKKKQKITLMSTGGRRGN